MKRTIHLLFAVLIAAFAVPLFALDDDSAKDKDKNIVDEVIRMWKANVGEDAIIEYVQKTDTHFTVSADDVIDMADAKVPRTVIKAVLDEADARGDRSRPVERQTYYVDGYAPGYWGGYHYYAPAYGGWYYDPFYYRPQVFLGFGFGYSRFYGGRGFHHFRGRRW